MKYGNFDIFNNIYIIEFACRSETPISIKSGRAFMDVVDNPVVRIYHNGGYYPYIPGSSLKGHLRSIAEQMARNIYGVESVCDVLNPDQENGELRRKKRMGENNYKPCVVCRIFGGPTIASHVIIYNAISKYDITQVIRRVSINRITGGQHSNRLFEIEFIPPGMIFKVKMELINFDIMERRDDTHLFNLVFNYIMQFGIRVGGMKSVGYGLLRINKDSIKITKFSIENGSIKSNDVKDDYLDILGDIL